LRKLRLVGVVVGRLALLVLEYLAQRDLFLFDALQCRILVLDDYPVDTETDNDGDNQRRLKA